MLTEYLRKGSLNTLFFGASSMLAKGLWLVCMPYILSKLPLTEIGAFDFYQSFFLIGSLIITSLCAQPLGRYYLKYRHDQQAQQTVLATSMRMVLVGALICLAVSLLALVRYTLYGDCYLLLFILFNAALYACFSFVTFFLQIREQRGLYMFLYVAQNVLALSIALICIHNGYGVASLFWANGISYLVCVPLFMRLTREPGAFNWQAAREQLNYGVPLALYNILYMLLFAVDRWYLAAQFGFKAVGLYAVLWYFGRIFVYATMALHDASPMLLYNAQHESDSMHIIARTVRYVTMVYVTGALFLVPFAYALLVYFLPAYKELGPYLPLFIMPLLFVETGRFWQAGFTLATHTKMIPLISLCTLVLQCALLYFLGPLGLAGVMLSNALAYSLYLLLNGVGSARVYSKDIFEVKPLAILFGFYGVYNLLFWHALTTPMPLLWMFLASLTWLPALWFGGVVAQDERHNILLLCKKYLQWAW